MVRTATPTRERILAAATTLFSRYGFKRASMEDIALEAGLSRAALYLQFKNKEDIFRELSRELHEEAMAQAEAALAGDGAISERLLRAIEAKSLKVLEIAYASPHGGELMDENNRLCGELAVESHGRFVEMIGDALKGSDASGEIHLSRSGLKAREAAELLTQSAAGLKLGDVSPELYRKRLAAFVRVFVAGLSA